MPRFTQDNTEGYTDRELELLNDVFKHLVRCNIPEDADLVEMGPMEDSIADAMHDEFAPRITRRRLLARMASWGWHI